MVTTRLTNEEDDQRSRSSTLNDSNKPTTTEFDDTLEMPQLNVLKATPWRSIIIAGILTVCHFVQFALYFSPMWPYLQILDPTITENFYGYVMASYSMGQIVAAPLMGYWSNRIKSVVKPTRTLFICVLIGNVIYLTAALMPSGRKWIILVARFLIGVSGSILSMMTAYAATASTPQDRSRAVAIITGSFSVGMFVGPALQLLFTPLGHGYKIIGDLELSIYTAPPITCCFVNVFALLLLKFGFEEKYAGLANEPVKKKRRNETEIKKDEQVYVPPYDKVAATLCHITRFTQFFTFSNLETIGAPFAMTIFALTKQETVTYLAAMHLAMGALGFSIYLLFVIVKMEQYFDFRKVCILSLVGFIVFHLITYSWPFLGGEVKMYSQQEYYSHFAGNSTKEPVGCPEKFHWCSTTTPINMWLYFVAYVVAMGACWAQSNVSLATILSKVLGPRRQAHQQSLYYTAGALARFTSPIIASHLYTANGPRLVWIVEILVLLLTIALWLLFYKRMVPLMSRSVETKDKN